MRRQGEGKSWQGMANWERLCFVLETRGPQTTGALGAITGIGQNVRGIMREANARLEGMTIVSYETWEQNSETSLPRLREWATYELVAREQAEVALLMHRRISETNRRVLRERRRALVRGRRRTGGTNSRPFVPERPRPDPRFGVRTPPVVVAQTQRRLFHAGR